jgi:hypothetical protein
MYILQEIYYLDRATSILEYFIVKKVLVFDQFHIIIKINGKVIFLNDIINSRNIGIKLEHLLIRFSE